MTKDRQHYRAAMNRLTRQLPEDELIAARDWAALWKCAAKDWRSGALELFKKVEYLADLCDKWSKLTDHQYDQLRNARDENDRLRAELETMHVQLDQALNLGVFNASERSVYLDFLREATTELRAYGDSDLADQIDQLLGGDRRAMAEDGGDKVSEKKVEFHFDERSKATCDVVGCFAPAGPCQQTGGPAYLCPHINPSLQDIDRLFKQASHFTDMVGEAWSQGFEEGKSYSDELRQQLADAWTTIALESEALAELRQQLATVTAERDELQDALYRAERKCDGLLTRQEDMLLALQKIRSMAKVNDSHQPIIDLCNDVLSGRHN